ncbi:MAG: ATP-binding protein [Bacteroidales bacterium]
MSPSERSIRWDRPSAAVGWTVCLAVSAVWAVLRLVVFKAFIFPITYALPLLLCVWTRDKAMLWSLAAAFAVLHTVKQWILLPTDALPALADWATYLATLFNIIVGGVVAHAIIVLRDRLEQSFARIEAQAAELERQNEELAQQSEELTHQNEELSQQNEEISEQSEELSAQNEELQAQAEDIRELNTELGHREALLQTLLDAARLSGPEKAALQSVCRTTLEMFGPPVGAVVVYELSGEDLLVRAAAGADEAVLTVERQPAANRFVTLVVDENRTACLDDASLRPDLVLLEVPGKPRFQAVLASPLRLGSHAFGAVAVYSREKHEWTTQHFRVAEWLADKASNILEALRLQEALRRQAALLDLTPDAILVRRMDGTITFWGKGAQRLYGFTPEEAIGRVSHQLLATRFPQPLEDIDNHVRQADRWTGELAHTARDGRTVHVESRWLARRDSQGAITELLESNVDITARKQVAEALEQANARLAEDDRRKDEFIAILSHELRNPLAPIRYALPMLERLKRDEAGAKALAVIDRQVEHLTRLVDDLLDVSRITRGKIELRRQHVTLASVVAAATEAASPDIDRAGHRLTVSVAPDAVWLHADPARVAQVITNLLNNSARYTPPGGEIALGAVQEDGYAVIRVRDNGMGIPPGELATIFEMFKQVRRPEAAQGGLGIGLGLVKRLVDMHGGSIEAHSDGEGRGAEFIVRLPVAIDGVPAAVSDASVPAVKSEGCLRVLIVDDNADLVEMLALVVTTAGHDVRTAFDGPSAVATALAYRPHVVLLDLGLPVMGGVEVAKQLRRHPDVGTMRLVALTGWGQAESRRQTLDAGFDHHLTKPTEPEELCRILAEIAAAHAKA